MGTPFIKLQEPFAILGYDRSKPPSEQQTSVPKTFLDAMAVREAVFVREQGVPMEYELDEDDGRSCHWVVYASINRVLQHEVRDDVTGEVIQPKRSETTSEPIGTIRLVPFPHPPHPRSGGKYVDGKLTNEGEEVPSEAIIAGDEGDGSQPKTVEPLTREEHRRMSSSMPFGFDRPTSMHDGKEPYVKLGRLAVVKEFRGRHISGHLVRTALTWIKEHPAYFTPSIREIGLDAMATTSPGNVPEWGGLVCCHAQEQVTKVWEKLGFQVDEKMGRWWEEGMPHVGMFQRLEVAPYHP